MKRWQTAFFICWIITGLLINSAYAQELTILLKQADSLLKAEDYTGSVKAYNAALKKSSPANYKLLGGIYLKLGFVSEKQGVTTKALEFYHKSLTEFEKTNNKERVASVSNNLGNTYRSLREFTQSLVYLKRAYSGWLEIKDSSHIPYALNNLGLVFMDLDSLNTALPYFKAVISQYGAYADKSTIASSMNNIASVLSLKNKYSEALRYYENSLKLRRELGDKEKTASLLFNISLVYRYKSEYKNALKAQRESLRLAKEINNSRLLQLGYNNYSDIYASLGNYKKAYSAAFESRPPQEALHDMFRDQYSYERDQNETLSKSLQQEATLSKLKIREKERMLESKDTLLLVLILASALTVIVISLLYKVHQVRQRNQRIEEKQRTILLESQLKDHELTALRAQMNPHFIFNALSSIKSFILEQNTELADYYLSKFAKLIRLILDNSSQNFVSLEKELQLLEAYIQLEQLRFENRFTYTIDVEPAVNTMEAIIPSMIIQPFVENAIIHGLLQKDGECKLQITIKKHEGLLMIVVQDNGIGYREANKTKNISGSFHQSKGYSITENRLKALNRSNNGNAHIVYKDLDDGNGSTGTRIEISICLQPS